MSSELLLFPHDVYGMVLNLEEDHVGAVLLGDDTLIKEGDKSNAPAGSSRFRLGDGMLGRVVNDWKPSRLTGKVRLPATRPVR